MADLRALREERARHVADARAILDAAEAESRDLSDEENAKYTQILDKADEIRAKIVREERQREAERELAAIVDDDDDGSDPGDRNPEARHQHRLDTAFRSWLMTGAARGEGAEEFRDLQAEVNTEGGYIVAPENFVAMLIKNVDDAVIIRGKATVLPLMSAASIGVPTLEADPADADWTTELQTGSEDSTMAFGKRRMEPHPVAKRIKVSRRLLQVAALPIEQIIRERLSYKFGITLEKAYLTGSGAAQPLGMFTASADGIPASRDISAGNSTTAIGADNLRNVKYSLKAQYMNTAEWLFHRDAINQISKLKDGDGQYLWQPGITAGDPDMLLGRPVNMSEYAPNTFTTGLYAGLFGDFRHYWIVDSLSMQLQRLDELYAETNQVGFIGRYEGDGAPVLAEAFTRIKLA